MEVVGFDRAGDEVAFTVRLVELAAGRWAGTPPAELADMVERDPRLKLEDGTEATGRVLRSGRTFAEVHGRLRRSRRLPVRDSAGPVLVIETAQANSD